MLYTQTAKLLWAQTAKYFEYLITQIVMSMDSQVF